MKAKRPKTQLVLKQSDMLANPIDGLSRSKIVQLRGAIKDVIAYFKHSTNPYPTGGPEVKLVAKLRKALRRA